MSQPPTVAEPNTLQRYASSIVVALMLIFFAQGYLSSLQKSLIWDEPSALGGGYAILAWGDYDVYLESPPLMQVLSAWGLYRSRPTEPTGWRDAPMPKVELGVELAFRGGVDHERVAWQARLPVLLLGTLLIGLIYAWGRRLLGVPAALAVTLLATFSPNLIAHSRVATADLGCTLFMFAAIAAFWWATQTGELKRWLVCGTLTGFALIAKFTALLLGPMYVLLVASAWLTRPNTRNVTWVARAAIPIAVMCWLVIAVAYGFDLDLSLYRAGVARIYLDLSEIYYNYLLGVPSQTPFWYYNPVAYMLKVPTAVLVLLLLSTVGMLGRSRKRREHVESPEPSKAMPERVDLENLLFLLIPPAVVIGIAFFDQTNLGLRRILPAFPFLLLFAGYAVREADSRMMQGVVATLLVWAVVAGVSVYPNHLAFFNIVAGGPDQAPYLLDDSNIDWGQDLPALAAWKATRPADEELRLLYHGNADPEAYGVRAADVLVGDMLEPRPGIYAVSVTKLTGFRKLMAHGVPGVDWLTEFEPIERIGHSIYIYEFR